MLLQEMTWPEIGNLSRDIPVLVPVAALEQHGRHMPVFTDSMLLGEVVRRVGEAMKDRVLIARSCGWGTRIITWTFRGRCQPIHASISICSTTWPRT